MKKGIQLLLMALAGVIVLAVTLVVFFVGFISFRKAEIDYVALTFVLVSELLFFIGAALLAGTSQDKVFTRSGVMTALALYWVVTTLISAFYKPLLGQNVNGLITAQVIVIAVAALAVIGVVMMSSRMAGITRAGQGSGSVLQESENAVFVLRGEAGRRGIPCSFDALYDLLKYSDRTVVVPEKENEIRSGIEDLRVLLSATDAAQTQEAIQAKVDELAARMQERNRLALQLKKGGM